MAFSVFFNILDVGRRAFFLSHMGSIRTGEVKIRQGRFACVHGCSSCKKGEEGENWRIGNVLVFYLQELKIMNISR